MDCVLAVHPIKAGMVRNVSICLIILQAHPHSGDCEMHEPKLSYLT